MYVQTPVAASIVAAPCTASVAILKLGAVNPSIASAAVIVPVTATPSAVLPVTSPPKLAASSTWVIVIEISIKDG